MFEAVVVLGELPAVEGQEHQGRSQGGPLVAVEQCMYFGITIKGAQAYRARCDR